MTKIYRVIQIKLNQLVEENVHMITNLPTKHIKRYHNDKHFSKFLPTRRRQKSAGIDMEQKTYITVTLCIRARHFSFPTTGGMTQATQIWAVSSK